MSNAEQQRDELIAVVKAIRSKVHAANRTFMTTGLRYEIRDMCDAALSKIQKG